MFKSKDKREDEDSDRFIPDNEFEKILREMEKIVGSAFKTSVDDWNNKTDNGIHSQNDPQYYRAPVSEVKKEGDIIEDDTHIYVTLELPDAKKEDILLEVSGRSLEIHVDSTSSPYYKNIDIPSEVKPDTAKATYKNGVLDIEIRKKKGGKRGYKTIID